MLAKLFGRKTDHPMADMKSAHALLDDLPKNDSLKSLMELTDWVESVAVSGEFKLEHQFAVIRLLDEAAYTHTRKLSRDYFSAQELPQFQENRLWLVLGSWHRNVFNAYFTVFQRYCEGDKGSSSIKASVSLLVARTIRAMMASLKFACVHYGPIDGRVWVQLGQLYKHAERQQYLGTPVSLYAVLPRPTTVQQEAAHLLAWYGCGVTSLSPLAMHLTERIIAQYIDAVGIQPQPTEHSLFGFDLNAPNRPCRVNIDATVHPYMRFVSMNDMLAKLENLIKVLHKNIVPDDLILGGEYEAELVGEAAEYLLKYVTALPQRRAVRKQIKIKAKVVSGFSRTVECTDVGLNFNANQIAEWQLKNISSAGFYTVLSQHGNEHVRIGELLGMQPEALSYWGVAVIRRLMRDDENHLHVGAEIISNQISAVALYQSGGGNLGFEDGQTALWLHHKVGEEVGGKVCLLMSKYVPNCSLKTELKGKKFLLIPHALKQKNLDCDLVEFRIIERDESEE
jgi:hypothetical protein